MHESHSSTIDVSILSSYGIYAVVSFGRLIVYVFL